jgi:hypothetical protein
VSKVPYSTDTYQHSFASWEKEQENPKSRKKSFPSLVLQLLEQRITAFSAQHWSPETECDRSINLPCN